MKRALYSSCTAQNPGGFTTADYRAIGLRCNLPPVKLNWSNAFHGIQGLATIAFAVACGRIVDPPLPVSATAFVPPPVYAKWWALTKSCSGISGSLENISWYVVPGVEVFTLKKETVSAYWTEGSNSIVVADFSVLDGSVVRHEMLHSLIRTRGHTRSAFLDHCLGVVSCAAACVADAGPPPRFDSPGPALPADSIDVGIDFLPNPPAGNVDGGVFSMVVSAHNRANRPVLVSLGPPGGSVAAPFSYDIRPAFFPGARLLGSITISDPALTRFAVGETKRQYFDFVIGKAITNRTITSGVYRVTASYGNHSTTISQFTIGAPP
ncbi:MAG: hypothetical protein ABIZ36_12050 [Gemmatimonadaceae bacterium]